VQTKKPSTYKMKIATIWAIARNLGIDSEYLHVLVFGITGSESISALKTSELNAVIDQLKKMQAKQNNTDKRNEKSKNVYQLPTPAQRNFLNISLLEVARILNLKSPRNYLESISERMFKKPTEKLTRAQFGNLIKQLREIINSTIGDKPNGH
jgi:hypothetical protein